MNATTPESVRNKVMVLIPKADMTKLVKAGYDNRKPIIKLFVANITWLVTGIEDGILYGYGDIGQQCVEWGSLIHVDELPTLKAGPFYMERDRFFTPKPDGFNYTELETLSGI
jgi:DUF2958 family protein